MMIGTCMDGVMAKLEVSRTCKTVAAHHSYVSSFDLTSCTAAVPCTCMRMPCLHLQCVTFGCLSYAERHGLTTVMLFVPQAKHGAPLLQLSAAQLAPVRQIKQAIQAAAAGAPRNDQCETCKVCPIFVVPVMCL